MMDTARWAIFTVPARHRLSTDGRVELPGFGLPLATLPYLHSVGPLQPRLPEGVMTTLPNALIGVS